MIVPLLNFVHTIHFGLFGRPIYFLTLLWWLPAPVGVLTMKNVQENQRIKYNTFEQTNTASTRIILQAWFLIPRWWFSTRRSNALGDQYLKRRVVTNFCCEHIQDTLDNSVRKSIYATKITDIIFILLWWPLTTCW